ncbi:MAG: glycosyl hydrolase, partial [Bacteroidetes bacterium]
MTIMNGINIMKKLALLLTISLTTISFAQQRYSFQNVMITNDNFPNEPSIIVNKHNTQNIVVGENSTHYYVSNDGGTTWVQHTINSNWGYGGDPSLNSDYQGNIYILHLSNSG